MKRMIYNVTRNSLWLQVVNINSSDVFIPILDIIECYPEITNSTIRLILKTATAQYMINYITNNPLARMNNMYSVINSYIYKNLYGYL